MADPDEARRVAMGLSAPMKAMLLRSRPDWSNEPPHCWGPSNTIAGLRNRGLAHGDLGYLTPLGLAVRAHLERIEHD